jgi:thiosulfate reductase/polysulfide reductase chain A
MSKQDISRRGFVIGGVGAAAVAAGAGYLGFSLSNQAIAETEASEVGTAAAVSLCNACPHRCGYTGYVYNGHLTRQIGIPAHPAGAGKLCAKGYGYSQIAYSPDRLTEPLKRDANGKFTAISWEQAESEIAEKIKSITSSSSAQALALIHGFAPTGSYYGKRFMAALGSANCYADTASANLSLASGTRQAIGTGHYLADTANAKLTVLIGANPAETPSPAVLQAIRQSRESGGRVIVVNSRCNRSTVLADEWVPINPGTELAFVLALANVVTNNRRYDTAFIEEQTEGFDEWAKTLLKYDARWAQKITGVLDSTIERIAAELLSAAPASALVLGWLEDASHASYGSGETARAVALFNTLLGNWNQKGGLILPEPLEFGELDRATIPAVPATTARQLGSTEYPLADTSLGSAAYAIQAANEGALAGAIFYEADPAADCSNTAFVKAALEKLQLKVVIDVQMTQTAQLADYVLPETSYLERFEIPAIVNGRTPSVIVSMPVISQVHPTTKTADAIFTELAALCGIGQYFGFTVEDLAAAQAKALGLSLDALKRDGVAYLNAGAVRHGELPKLATPSGKIQFTSSACAAAGYSASPTWVASGFTSAEEQAEGSTTTQLFLIGGEEAVWNRRANNIEDLADIAKHYDLARARINSATAAELGIADGDEIEISSDVFTGRTRVKVSQAIHPTALYLPSNFGCTSSELSLAYNMGLNQLDFAPFSLEPGYGAAITQGVPVTVKKVGA